MAYTVIIFKADGTVESTVQPKKPTYNQLRDAVGGYIQEVPYLKKYGDFRRGTAFANEDGISLGLKHNAKATQAWLESVGKGPPYVWQPRLYGDVIYYARS
jgi:hypothetical protein